MKKWLSNSFKAPAAAQASGYTIIEVMIVLAITGVLFTSAVLVFNAQQGKTALSQSLYDLSSKLQSYATEVNSGIYPDSQSWSCSLNASNRPVLTSGGTSGSNDKCLFIGRAVQVIPSTSDIYAYSVLANNSQSGSLNLEPAYDGSNWQLYDHYALPSNERISLTKLTTQTGTVFTNYNLLGIYISQSGTSGTNSSTALNMTAYNYNSGSPFGGAKACIEGAAPCGSSYSVRSYTICVNDGSKVGDIILTTSSTGITSQVRDQADPGECS